MVDDGGILIHVPLILRLPELQIVYERTRDEDIRARCDGER